jgi:hypothetical protein
MKRLPELSPASTPLYFISNFLTVSTYTQSPMIYAAASMTQKPALDWKINFR